MAKYIDADTMVGLRFFDDTCGIEKTTIEVDTIENILDNFTEEGCPEPADVVPVVHGRWIRGKYTDDDLRYNDYSYRCNRCGKVVDFEENYCPKCGAKMNKE